MKGSSLLKLMFWILLTTKTALLDQGPDTQLQKCEHEL